MGRFLIIIDVMIIVLNVFLGTLNEENDHNNIHADDQPIRIEYELLF